MSYDQFEDFKRQQAYQEKLQNERFFDHMRRHNQALMETADHSQQAGASGSTSGAFGLLLLPFLPFLWLWHDLSSGWIKIRLVGAVAGGLGIALILAGFFVGIDYSGNTFVYANWILRVSTDLLVVALLPRSYAVFAAFLAALFAIDTWVVDWLAPHINWTALEPYTFIGLLLPATV